MKAKISVTIESKTLKEIDRIVDNLYIRNRSQAIEYLAKKSLGENRIAVILCGGGDDKLRISRSEYRPTVEIKNAPVVEHAIKKLRESGFKSVFIIARQNVLTKIFEVLKDGSSYGVKTSYIEEKKSNGTADSLRPLKGKVNSTFLVVYGDILFKNINIEDLWNEHIKQNAITTIMLTTSSKPSEKGTVKVEGNRVLNFTQKPKESDIYLVFSPIFAAEPEIFDYSGESLEKDVFPLLAEKGLLNGRLSSEKEKHIHRMEDLNS